MTIGKYVAMLGMNGVKVNKSSMCNYVMLLFKVLSEEDLILLARCGNRKNSRVSKYARQELARRYHVVIE